MPDTDPNQVRLTGENSFIRLLEVADGPQLTRVSHWRILFSPAGAGHALFRQRRISGQLAGGGRPQTVPAARKDGRTLRVRPPFLNQ